MAKQGKTILVRDGRRLHESGFWDEGRPVPLHKHIQLRIRGILENVFVEMETEKSVYVTVQ